MRAKGLTHPLVLVVSLILKALQNPKYVTFACGSQWGNRFEGNMKYLFLYMSNTRWKDLNPMWITPSEDICKSLRGRKYNAVLSKYKIDTLRVYSQTGVLITDSGLDSVNYIPKLLKASVIDLWHGIPLKGVGRPPRDCSLKTLLFSPWMHKSCTEDYVLVTSKYVLNLFKKTGLVSYSSQAIISGYPRVEFLLKGINTKEFRGWEVGISGKVIDYILNKKDYASNYIVYMPTYRDKYLFNKGSHRVCQNIIVHIEKELIDGKIFNMECLAKFLEKTDAYLFIKTHYFTHRDTESLNKLRSALKKITDKIVVLNPWEDIYPLLVLSDVLITDYSSVMFDYIVLDRPIVLYPYDFEEYTSKRRLLLDYKSIVPGPICKSYTELYSILEESIQDPNIGKDKRKSIFKILYNDPKILENACERICLKISELMKIEMPRV